MAAKRYSDIAFQWDDEEMPEELLDVMDMNDAGVILVDVEAPPAPAPALVGVPAPLLVAAIDAATPTLLPLAAVSVNGGNDLQH